MAKICMKCGREFEDRSVRCPICRLNLVSIENDNAEKARREQQRMQQARDARHARSIQAQERRGMQEQEIQGRPVRDTQLRTPDRQTRGAQSRGVQDRQSRSTQPRTQGRTARGTQSEIQGGQTRDTQSRIQQPSQNKGKVKTGYQDYQGTRYDSGAMATAHFDGRHLHSVNLLIVYIDDVKVDSFYGGSTCVAQVKPGKHIMKYHVYNDATEENYWLGPFEGNFEAGVEYDIYPGMRG